MVRQGPKARRHDVARGHARPGARERAHARAADHRRELRFVFSYVLFFSIFSSPPLVTLLYILCMFVFIYVVHKTHESHVS